jgi:hypothetical protein
MNEPMREPEPLPKPEPERLLQPGITPEHAEVLREAVRDYYAQRDLEQFERCHAPLEMLTEAGSADAPVPYTLTPRAEAALSGPEPEAGG